MIKFSGSWDLILKKSGHLWIYALLGGAILWALAPWKIHRPVLASWVLTVLYAFSDELHQYFVPGRGATLIDVGIDAVGAAIGIFVVQIVILNR